MNTRIASCFAVLTLLTAVSSCRTVYAPNAINVPLLQEKGEVKILAAANNLQVAGAVSEHVGLMANGYLNRYKSDDKSFRNEGKGFEIGAGYFTHQPNRLSYEVYGGVGFYNVMMSEQSKTKTFESNATKLFIQPSIGYVHKYFEVAITPRLTTMRYGSPDLTGYTTEEQQREYFDVLSDRMHVFLEPAVTVRGGYKFVKLQLQYGYSYKLSKNPIRADSELGSIGLIFDIGRWYNE